MELQLEYLAIFHTFSIIYGFEWYLMGILPKDIQLVLELLKVLFLDLHFSYCIILTYLMMSVRLLFMLMMLLSDTTNLICGNNMSWLLNLNPTYATL